MSRWIDAADTAKLLRAALKREFPQVKFAVRLSRYSGGSSIRVGWTDGPITRAVEAVADLYQGRSFDGSIDLEFSRDAYLYPDGSVSFAATTGTEGSRGSVPAARAWMEQPGGERVRFGASYVHCERTLSPALRAALEHEIAAAAGASAYDPNARYSVWVDIDESRALPSDTDIEYGSTLLHRLQARRAA